LRYPAPGSPALAQRVRALLAAAGHDAHLDLRRGLDHGAWVPLMLMFPQADLPVVQLSVQSQRDGAHHLSVGRALAPLAGEGVLVLGSGGATHPLAEALRGDWSRSPPPTEPWSAAFDLWLAERIEQGDAAALADWPRAPHAARNHPTPEHFLPLVVAAGAAGGARGARVHAGWAYHLLSMAAFRWPA
jgi:4,5-DOPA dioxygenase extradiol